MKSFRNFVVFGEICNFWFSIYVVYSDDYGCLVIGIKLVLYLNK